MYTNVHISYFYMHEISSYATRSQRPPGSSFVHR